MLVPRSTLRRIPPIRPLRPPNIHEKPPRPRLFTKNSQLLLVSPTSPRPQLPFLSPSSRRFPNHQRGGQWQARLISTETKRYVKEQFWLATKWTAYLWTLGGLLFIASIGVQHEKLSRKYPSPDEWGFWTKWSYRLARAQDSTEWHKSGMIDWAGAGYKYKQTLAKLERPNKEGKDLIPQEGVPGYDLSNKSYAWKQGYFEILMGCAKMAEHLDGWLRDNTRGVVFPPEVVKGPSNPNPRPVPPGAFSAPHEKDCSPAYEPPDVYYSKLLTTKGFTTRQRLDATIAYADYLSFKGRSAEAERTYKSALDIAASALPSHGATVIDTDSGTIKEDAPAVTENILHASTQLALHHARTAHLSSALPILLSVLRARRAAPLDPYPPTRAPDPAAETWVDTVWKYVLPPKYPPPPPSGDTPFLRHPGPDCEDAALMTWIGEILFASAPGADGVNWTREAVGEAERGALDLAKGREERAKCAQCLEVGLGNWGKMVGRLAREERERQEQREKEKVGGGRGWRLLGGGARKEDEVSDLWQREERMVEEKIERVRKEGLAEKFRAAGSHTPGGVWMG